MPDRETNGRRIARISRSYAFRERVSTGAPIRRVRLVDIVGCRGKVKIRYEDEPHSGLEEYVPTCNLIVPWGEVRALLGTRSGMRRSSNNSRGLTAVIRQASQTVFQSSGEDIWAPR